MLRIGDKEFRNLQEQVGKNQEDIEALQNKAIIGDLGIKIVSAEPFPSAEYLPLPYSGEYGDAFLVGTAQPYELYIWTRESNDYAGEWFDWGPLNAPSIIPGPIGEQGPAGPQGQRGSTWSSQSGNPTQILNMQNGDQFLNTTSGDVYQFTNGVWQRTGSIKGPKGNDGIAGPQGPQGPAGQQGPQGLKGEQGQFITIIATLTSINQLPAPASVPRSYAYLILEDGVEYVYLIVGEGTTESPLTWHNAGSFSQGSGTKVIINGVQYEQVDMTNVPQIPMYLMEGNTGVAIDTGSNGKITIQLKGTSPNFNETSTVTKDAMIDLPIVKSNDIEPVLYQTENDSRFGFQLTNTYKQTLEDQIIAIGAIPSVQITAPTTATNGQLTAEQLTLLQSNNNAYILFNNEMYRLQDNAHEAGFMVYSHVGYENTSIKYIVKCITITISTRGWVLTSYNLPTFLLDSDTLNITM